MGAGWKRQPRKSPGVARCAATKGPPGRELLRAEAQRARRKNKLPIFFSGVSPRSLRSLREKNPYEPCVMLTDCSAKDLKESLHHEAHERHEGLTRQDETLPVLRRTAEDGQKSDGGGIKL